MEVLQMNLINNHRVCCYNINMNDPSVFSAKSYRDFIREWISSRDSARGLQGQMCEAMECQSAHLSRALQDKVHLTMDQAFLLTQFLGLGKAETGYFLKLTERDRAGSPKYRSQISEELEDMKQAHDDLATRFKQERIGNHEQEAIYYSSWHWIAIHYITASEKFQTPQKIADRLGLEVSFIRSSLETLEQFGLVKRKGDRWILNSGSIHMPKTSPLNSIQHGNWRNRAVLKSQNQKDDGLHYTIVQTISEDDFVSIKQQLLNAIDKYRKTADASPSEEITCFAIDFFRA